MRILIVEDEPKIAKFTSKALLELSYVTDIANTCERARELLETQEFDLIVLDIMLPDGDGISLCREFKAKKPATPILMLTTMAEIFDKVKGLNSGADDYMTKPFHLEELSARVHALLRRHNVKGLVLHCADLELDLVTREAKRNGQLIKLTGKEFGLLEYLLRNVRRPMSRVQIAQHVWDLHFDPESNVVDAYIKQLRKKIDSDHAHKLIKTIVGLGYVISDE